MGLRNYLTHYKRQSRRTGSDFPDYCCCCGYCCWRRRPRCCCGRRRRENLRGDWLSI